MTYIQLTCPRCHVRHKASVSQAGMATLCSCGERLEIPNPLKPELETDAVIAIVFSAIALIASLCTLLVVALKDPISAGIAAMLTLVACIVALRVYGGISIRIAKKTRPEDWQAGE